MRFKLKQNNGTSRFMLIAPLTLATILFVIVIVYLAVPYEKKIFMQEKKNSIKDLTYSAWSTLQYYDNLANDNVTTMSNAMQSAKNHIQSLRYGPDQRGYFWIIDTQYTCHANANITDIEGYCINEMRDTEGKYFIREIVEAAINQGEDFITYSGVKGAPDLPGTAEKKTFFIKYFEPWDWIIATGFEHALVDKEYKNISRGVIIAGLIVTIISIILSIGVVIRCIKGENRRLRTEELLIESEKKYSALVETTGTGWVILDEKGTILDANLELLRLTGVSQLNEVIGRNIRDLTSQESGPQTVPFIEECLKTGQTRAVELDFESKDGRVTAVEINASTEKTRTGTRILALCRDISQRRKRETEVNQLAAAINEVAESIIVTDEKGIITYVNPWFEKMTGYAREEILGRDTSILSDGTTSDRFYNALWETISSGKTWRGVFKNKKKDGTLFEEESVISPVHNAHGKIISYVAVKHDVTQEQQLEHQIRRSQKMAAIGHLAHKVAHDFTNVLAMVIGNAQMVKKSHPDSRKLNQQMDDIIYAGNKTAMLTTELLSFAHPTKLALKTVKLNNIVTGLDEILQHTLPDNIRTTIKMTDIQKKVSVDPAQIEQVIVHMAINSVEAMPEGGNLTIETRLGDPKDPEVMRLQNYANETYGHYSDYAIILITDTGCGIGPESLPRIFDPFFSTKKTSSNSGLGLSTSYKIIEQHKGFITLTSRPGEGTTFKIFLPITE